MIKVNDTVRAESDEYVKCVGILCFQFGVYIFPVQHAAYRVGNHTRLVPICWKWWPYTHTRHLPPLLNPTHTTTALARESIGGNKKGKLQFEYLFDSKIREKQNLLVLVSGQGTRHSRTHPGPILPINILALPVWARIVAPVYWSPTNKRPESSTVYYWCLPVESQNVHQYIGIDPYQ